MSMPYRLTFVRHGQSEANVVQATHKAGGVHPNEQEILARPDWQQRLSAKGVEQARIAREWLEKEIGGVAAYDLRYVSYFLRGRETAVHLGGLETTGWRRDDRIVERNWGVYGRATAEEKEDRFALTTLHKQLDPLNAGLDGGESLTSGVLMRERDFLHTLHREAADKTALVVTHGEFMWTVRYDIERMAPEDWQDLDEDPTQKIRNCAVLDYSRVNPEDSEDIRKPMKWMRLIYPDNEAESPYGGKWQEIPDRKEVSGADLLEQVNRFPTLIGD